MFNYVNRYGREPVVPGNGWGRETVDHASTKNARLYRKSVQNIPVPKGLSALFFLRTASVASISLRFRLISLVIFVLYFTGYTIKMS